MEILKHTGSVLTIKVSKYAQLTLRAGEHVSVLFEQSLGNKDKTNTFRIQRTIRDCDMNKGNKEIVWEYFFKDEELYFFVGGSPFIYHMLEYTLEGIDTYDYYAMKRNLEKEAVKQAQRPAKRAKSSHFGEEIRRLKSDSDFTIRSHDWPYPVHTEVLKARWPAYKTVKETMSMESPENVLEINAISPWVEKFVDFIYGRPFEADFDRITGLLMLGDEYELPGLVEYATEEIIKTYGSELHVEMMLMGWHRAADANNERVKSHFMKLMMRKLKEGGAEKNFEQLFGHYESHQLLDLFESAVGV